MKQREFDFFEKPDNVKILKNIAYASLAIVVVIGFFIKGHGHFPWESIPGFWAVAGFVACVMIVVFSKTIGKIWLEKKEDYYE